MTRRLRELGMLLAVALLAGGCAAGKAFSQGDAAMRAGNLDEAVAAYRRAVQAAPDNANYKIALERTMLAASRAHLEQGAGSSSRRISSRRRSANTSSPANTTRATAWRPPRSPSSIARFATGSRRRGPWPAIEQMRERGARRVRRADAESRRRASR